MAEKRGRPSAKELEAREKVTKLLDGIELSTKQKKAVVSKVSKEVVGGVNELEEKQGNAWLEEQLDIVTEEAEKLRSELVKFKNNTSNLQPPQQVSDNITQQQARNFFKEIEGIYTGRNPKNARFPTVHTKTVLDITLKHFPFLMNK